MDFSFTEEQERFRNSLRKFCGERIAPRAGEIDGREEIPSDLVREMAAFGLFGMTISGDYGGSGSGFVQAAMTAEQVAWADMSMAAAVYYLVQAGWGFILERYGNREVREEVLPDMVNGKRFLGIASTEGGGGSDIAALSTTMEKRGDKLVLNGAKAYISGVQEAAQNGGGYVTVVKTDPLQGHRGLSLCYLPIRKQAGVTIGISKQMGREGISNGFIQIQEAELPAHYLIGEWNRGFYYAMEGFNCARTLVAAACLGAAGRALDAGVERIKRRKAFQSPLARFQGIQFSLAENFAKLESARLLVYKAAWMLDRKYSGVSVDHSELNRTVAAAKLVAPAAAFDIIKDVMMWHGAYGYTREAGLERGLRGVMSYIVGAEGTPNIMKLIISRELLGKEFS